MKVNATKTKVAKQMKNPFLGITYYKELKGLKCEPTGASKKRLYEKHKLVWVRKRAIAGLLENEFKRINSIIRGWIYSHRVGSI
ncbi:MAG: hypothetical protein ACK5NF_00075 [Bacilli bacterium]